MVIVSAKNIQNSKKKTAATASSSASSTSKSTVRGNVASKTFVRPPPRPLTIGGSSVGGGRGKVKTTRNNTLPLPSPKSGLLNSTGPRIHAQRKFAQGATAPFSSSGHSVPHTSRSPAVTPTKDSSKFRKRVLTPISPPLKRPKTEDFLTFLCFRGTPSLPPELDYFNFSQPLEVDEAQVQSKKPKESVVSTGVGCTSSFNYLQNGISAAVERASTSTVTFPPLRTAIVTSTSAKLDKTTASRDGKQLSSNKLLGSNKRGGPSSLGLLKKRINGVNGLGTRIDSPPKKDVPGPETKTTKVAKKNTSAATPQISPSASRINEQDAKFAMTALKLKYQEKRLANARPAKSLITMLTKKVKERSMVLTRSRAKTAVGPLKTSPIKRKLTKPVVRPAVKPLPRNAPSPDIILGIAQSPVKAPDTRRSSSSDSSSSSESKKSSSSSSSSSSDSSNSESEEETATTRSLRSGKEVVTKSKPKTKPSVKKKSSPTRRIGTRAAHRNTKSPLRELPMWNVNVKKKKILAKYKKNAKNKAKNANKSKQATQPTPNKTLVTRSSLRKSSGTNDTKGRPSRKTKETAAIHLGLLNKDFSSDEQASSDESDQDDRSSSVGDTSASETKFLEKQYNAALKRTSNKKKERASSLNRLRSKEKQSSKPKDASSSNKSGNSSSNKSSDKSKEKKSQQISKKKEETKPLPRVLRSRSSGSVDSSRTESSIAAKRRLLMMTCGKDTAGAARKSAKIVSRGRRRHYSSSSEGGPRDSTSDTEDGDDEEEEEDEVESRNSESDSQEATEDEEPKVKPTRGRSRTESPMSIPSSRSSRAKSKRVVELIEENKRSYRSSSRSLASGSPVDHKSVSDDSKSIASEMRRLVEQQQTDTMGHDEEDEEEEEDEDDDEIATRTSPSVHGSVKEEEMRADDNDDDGHRTPVESHHSDSTSPAASSAESESEEDEDDTPEPPQKVSIACQVDMDLEEEEEEKRRVEEEEEKRRKQQEEEKRRQEEEAAKKPIATSSVSTSIELPLSEEQRAELQQAQEEDDEIQEIGQVINNPTTVNSSNTRHHHHASPPIITEQPQGTYINPPPPPQPEHIPMSIPHPLPPLSSRTSSLTYTSHHINLGGSSVPYVPYSRPSDFYPPLHFGPTHLVNSVHLVGSSTAPGVDFGNEFASPLSTLSIPVSVPTLPSFPNPLLPPAPPSFLGHGATMTATSLQTHIRTVATNLDIPLVRPVMGSDTSLPFMGMGQTPQLGSMPFSVPCSVSGAMNNLLPRPLGPWPQPSADARTSHHYSAFRLPTMQPTSTASSTNIGVKEVIRPPTSNTLPVSIVHPRTLPQQHQQLPHQHHQQQQQQPLHQQQPPLHHSISTTHVVHNIREIHHHHASSTASAYMQNYNPESIIRTLPNVSIVPKFDRSSAKTQLPSQQPTSSSSSKKQAASGKSEEPKKPGKKKKSSTLPMPSSPLTVRKDSSNPVTYKTKKKSDTIRDVKESSSSSASSSHWKDESDKKDSHKFDKLLQLKQGPSKTDGTSASSSSSGMRESSIKERSSPAIHTVDSLVNIKQEVPLIVPSNKKSRSPSITSHRNTPDRPSSSGSAASTSGKAHQQEKKRKESSSSSKKSAKNTIVEAPTYYPTEQEFEDPLKYFDKIQTEAEKYGMARIVPPRSFRPECNVNDDMRFTAYNHYIHKMFKRWGPTVQETEAIKEHLKRSDVDLSSVPVVGGIEIDFSTLYQAVQSFGGLKEVIEQEKWADVADSMHIPKGTHDRGTKLDTVYMKYLLPYDLLSEGERENLKSQVNEKWAKRQQKLKERTDESSEDETSDEDSMDELDDCVIKGKGTPLSSYYRTARNTVSMIFPNGKEPPVNELEEEYWKIVREGKKHLCVYSGSIDCAGVGWGFPAPKPSSKHPWNLKVLANNSGSVLRSMGPVMGATVPTLHVSMLFTSYCWYRDPHGLAWVEYLHSGASKIWYSVASMHEQVFRKALTKLMPLQCKNKKLWLPSDSAMVPPELLVENNVPLVRAVQNPGEFLVVFPKSYTSAICGGYLVSESVCFAPPVWLKTCMEMFKDIRESKEPPVFAIEKLLISIIRDNKASNQIVKMAIPLAEKVILEELSLRKKLIALGVSQGGKPNVTSSGKGSSKKKRASTEEEAEQCYFCNYILHLSLVRNERTDFVTCLPHAIQHLSRHKAQIKKCTLLCEETQEELESLLQTAKRRANS